MPDLPKFENHAEQETKFTTCYMCACRCGVKVTLENGKVRFVQGNPDHPVNRGVLCGKGNAAIMKQYSPAKLRAPMMREPGTERGEGKFVEVSWEEALAVLTKRLAAIRADNPNKLAFFTGRDQMQALTGFWAAQFGTMNWAAHGGFCSVNMAAAGLLTTGFSFWEFGEPDWAHTKYFMLWGVAEDHSSNPIKIGLKTLKERGVKIVAINPVRTGYQAIADEWVAITPGTDGILAMAMARTLLQHKRIDEDFLVRYTNLPFLVEDNPGADGHGLFVRDADGAALVWDGDKDAPRAVVNDVNAPGGAEETPPLLFGRFTLPDGRQAVTAMQLLHDRCMEDAYAPENAAEVCGVTAETIERLALEAAAAAFDNPVVINTPWTDAAGRQHSSFVGRAVSMHAMRGISAHANGFQTCRAIHVLQVLLGAVDTPGGHLAKPPYPKHPPAVPPPATRAAASTPLSGVPLGIPLSPADLAVDDEGRPLRIDKAFSWEAPLSAHGAMHTVLANAAAKDPYAIDTLMIFMANLAWNSSMDTNGAIAALTKKDADGEYAIPFIAVCDAFQSEMVMYADLVLPDTTYFERHDTISFLDRPISEAHAACDAIRVPVVAPDADTRPWQEVMIELAARLQLPAFVDADGTAKYAGYCDFINRWEKTPGIGFLAGWRGEDGETPLKGAPHPNQWQRYEDNGCFFRYELPEAARYYRFANRDYLRLAKDAGWIASDAPMTIEVYSEVLQRFRLAGDGVGARVPPDGAARENLRRYFDPLPFWYSPNLSLQPRPRQNGTADNLFYAVTQRPMFMYHSWDSQNAWLRQIADRNPIFMHETAAARLGVADGAWVWLASPLGRVAAQVKTMQGVQQDTVWTWNAIGKMTSAKRVWGLSADAAEGKEGFLLNHLIPERFVFDGGVVVGNSDPVTGQAAWYDLVVSVTKMSAADVAAHLRDKEKAVKTAKAADKTPLRYATHQAVRLIRPLTDVLLRK